MKDFLEMLKALSVASIVILSAASQLAASPYLHREFYGLGLTSPLVVARSQYLPDGSVDPTCAGAGSPCPGTGLWAITQMYDANNNIVPFCVDSPRRLICGGRTLIRHRGVVLPGFGDSYAIYAHATLHLLGPYPSQDAMPERDWSKPDPLVMMDGQNIAGVAAHYYRADLSYSVRLPAPGCYRISVMTGAGTDAAPTRDDLADLPSYGQSNIHQFWCQVQ